MIKTNDIMSEMELIEKLPNSTGSAQKNIDELWAKEARRRIEEIKTGNVKPIPGEEVFNEIWRKLSK